MRGHWQSTYEVVQHWNSIADNSIHLRQTFDGPFDIVLAQLEHQAESLIGAESKHCSLGVDESQMSSIGLKQDIDTPPHERVWIH